MVGKKIYPILFTLVLCKSITCHMTNNQKYSLFLGKHATFWTTQYELMIWELKACAAVPVVTTVVRAAVFVPPKVAYSLIWYCVSPLRPVSTVERTPAGKVRPVACVGKADSLTSTIKLSNAFSPVRQESDTVSDVMFETTSPDKSGSAATGGKSQPWRFV